jgi:hypothetical protein
VKDGSNDVEGCHPSEEAADSQMAALYAQEEAVTKAASELTTRFAANTHASLDEVYLGGDPSSGTPADKRLKENECPDGQRMLNGKCVPKHLAMMMDGEEAGNNHSIQPWTGVLVVEGSDTGDGRQFAVDSLSWEEPAASLITLGWQPKDKPQHEEAVTVGRVDIIEREYKDDGTTAIRAWGVIDMGSEHGREVVRQVKGGYAGGLSVDVDSVGKVEIIFPDEPVVATADEDGRVPSLMMSAPEKKVYHEGRIRGVTLCRLPALVEGRLELIGDPQTESLVAAGDPLVLTAAETDSENTVTDREALTSAGIPIYPPADWFADPNFKQAVPFTITDEGQVFGHLALWGTCHTTFPHRCITPPKEREHAFFLRHELRTREDESVSVGTITFGIGHASTQLGAVPAAEHYDDTNHGAADINVGEDAHGIWIAGALRPRVNEEQLRELRGASLSGDWRVIAGKLRLVAVLAVNVPGFPVPRMRAAAATEDGPWTALVAAGVATSELVSVVNGPYPPGTIVVRRAIAKESV